jgi:hypothetical protein
LILAERSRAEQHSEGEQRDHLLQQGAQGGQSDHHGADQAAVAQKRLLLPQRPRAEGRIHPTGTAGRGKKKLICTHPSLSIHGNDLAKMHNGNREIATLVFRSMRKPMSMEYHNRVSLSAARHFNWIEVPMMNWN